ncbi:hypothetical protein T06_12493 [Trichinella sp. T6]|nr:hypothetical protein T06_12493 [Trichinella sp. T6]
MVQVQVWSNAVMTRKVHWWRRLESIRERKLAGLIEHNFSRLVTQIFPNLERCASPLLKHAQQFGQWKKKKPVALRPVLTFDSSRKKNQEQQRISKKQKRRKSLDLLAVHTLLQKALANVDHYCLSKLVTQSIWADDNGIEWKKSDEASDQLGHDQAWLIDRPSMG